MNLSICFITRNRRLMLKRAIDSCLNKGLDEYEFIIVDNGSNDGTCNYICKYLSENKIAYQYYYSSTNLGVAGGRNKCYEMAQGKYLFFLDDDAIVPKDCFFHELIERIERDPQIIAAGMRIFEPATGVNHSEFITKEGNKIMANYSGGAHIIKKDYVDDSFLYPDTLMFGAEENYFCHRAYFNGYIIPYYDDLEVLHLPENADRILGDLRTIQSTINIYAINRLILPRSILWVSWLFFVYRMLRYGFRNYYGVKEVIKMLNDRYEKDKIRRGSVVSVLKTMKLLGYRRIL